MGIEKIRSFYAGEWRTGAGDGVSLFNPTTEEHIARASVDGLDVQAALTHARSVGTASLGAMTFRERAELLANIARALHGRRETLIDASIRNGGCTRSDAKFDVDGAIGTLNAYAEIGRELGDERVFADGPGVQLGRSPRNWGEHIWVSRPGVALLINAFNFPAWGFAEKAACAWLAGMPVVTKPATSTALAAYEAARAIIEDVELPRGAFAFIAGGASELMSRVDFGDIVAFTGSADTARRIRTHPRVVERNVRVNVEADSLNAAILGPDVELGSDAMALFTKDVVREMTQKSGQKCTAVRRILVSRDRVDDVIDALSSRLSDITIGDPTREDVQMGPLATKDQLDDARAGIVELAAETRAVFGDPTKPVEAKGVERGRGWFHPIVLLREREGAELRRVHEREVFGPVATVLTYAKDAREAAAIANRGMGALVASVYSDDRPFTETFVRDAAPFHGRIYIGSSKLLEHAMGSGLALPQSIHGGPGRAGEGEELGGLRGVERYMQRVALQGYRTTVEAIARVKPAG